MNMALCLEKLGMALVAVALLGGCREEKPRHILPSGVRLEAGDVVFRRGGGFTSRMVLFADTAGNYSHVGIVVDSAGVLRVVHAVPDEPDYEGDPDRVKMESPEAFYAGTRADIGCVLRHRDGDVARRAAAAAQDVYRRGTLFDHDYDAADTTRMYCCELVAYAYAAAGRPLHTGERHDISIPGLALRGVILPSDFFRDRALRLVSGF